MAEPESFQPQGQTVILPKPEAIAELGKLRKRELTVIAQRLGRLPKHPWARWWERAATVLIGTALGGFVAGIPLIDEKTSVDTTLYWVIVVAVFVGGALCVVGALSTHAERADSIKAIKEDLDELLDMYAHEDAGKDEARE